VTKAAPWSIRPLMTHKTDGSHSGHLIIIERPTGFWITWSDDRECYVAGPFATEALARKYMEEDET